MTEGSLAIPAERSLDVLPRRPHPVRRPRGPLPPDAAFDQFWDAYAHKVGKKEARRIWERQVRQQGVNPNTVIKAAERFAAERERRHTQKQYIPHPGSWLGDERWLDEAEQESLPALHDLPAVIPAELFNEAEHEQLLAEVIRLADPDHPIAAAISIIRAARRGLPRTPALVDLFPPVTPERAAELKGMPYPEYLLTPEWRARRVPMLEQAGHRCMVCCSPERLHVHHRTYARRGNELPSDLIVLCESCHDLFHENGKLVKEPAA